MLNGNLKSYATFFACCLSGRKIIVTMKKALLFFIPVLAFTACEKCDDEDGEVCTADFRMITLTVKSSSMTAIALDSVYTIRQSTNEKIRPQQPMAPGVYVVLDDSYH